MGLLNDAIQDCRQQEDKSQENDRCFVHGSVPFSSEPIIRDFYFERVKGNEKELFWFSKMFKSIPYATCHQNQNRLRCAFKKQENDSTGDKDQEGVDIYN